MTIIGGKMKLAFTSTVPFLEGSDHTLVVHCADPRFVKATKEFLQSRGLERYDVIALAGGPVQVVVDEKVAKQVALLNKLHELRTVIGIAHGDCGFYRRTHPNNPPEELLARQLSDQEQFRETVTKLIPNAKVETVLAKETNGRIGFFEV